MWLSESLTYPALVCITRKCPCLCYWPNLGQWYRAARTQQVCFLFGTHTASLSWCSAPWWTTLWGCVSWNQNEGVLIMDIDQQCVRRQKAAVCRAVSVMYLRSAGQWQQGRDDFYSRDGWCWLSSWNPCQVDKNTLNFNGAGISCQKCFLKQWWKCSLVEV